MEKKPTYEALEQKIKELEKELIERKRAEEALRSEKDKLEALMEGLTRTQIGIDIVSTNYRILFQNQALKERFGDLTGQLCYEKYMGRENPCDFCPMIESIESGKVENVQLNDAHGRTYKLFSAPLPNPDGTVDKAIEVVLDITESNKTKEELQESGEQYRVSIESAPYGIMVHDHGGNILILNSQFEKITGYSKEEIPDVRAWIEKAYPDKEFRRLVLEARKTITPEECPRTREATISRKDGEKRLCQFVSNLMPSGIRMVFITDITERKQAERALRESEEKYRSILESIEEGYYEVDIAGNIIFVNESLCTILGYSREEIIGINNRKYMDKENARRVYHDFNKVYRTEKPTRIIDWEIIRKDGTRRNEETSVSLMKDKEGTKIGFRGMVRDITERKQAEQALRESEREKSAILNTVSELVAYQDTNHTVLWTNKAAAESVHANREDLKGRKCYEIWAGRDKRCEICPVAEAIETGEIQQAEITTPDGKVWVIKGYPIKNEVGRIIGAVEVTLEVTTQKQAEDELRRSEEKYRTIVQTIEDGYFEVDMKGSFTFFNDALCHIFGLSAGELMGKNFRAFADEETNKKCYTTFNRVYTVGEPENAFDWEITRKDGTIRYIEASISLRKDANGHPIGFQGIIRDITEKKRRLKETKTLQAQLQKAQKMEAIGTLAGGIAHNFNNLLMTILGNTSLMILDTPPDHPHYERLASIEKSVQSGSTLTNQLLGYARGGQYELKALSVNRIIEETSVTFAMTRKDITLHHDLEASLSGVRADHSQIEQVILNIYVNAAEAMGEGGELFVTTRNIAHTDIQGTSFTVKPVPYILITIRDTGIGMDEEIQERIFDPFFTTKGLAKGTGLGLSSVYGIIKAHGGYIDVASQKGEGTTFFVYLPASRQPIDDEHPQTAPPITGTETILLVDDEETICEVGKDLLASLGYTVMTARSGKEAIESLEKADPSAFPDLVILDMIMPEMGGGATYDRMKELYPTIKVLLSSGYSIDGQATEIIKRGCNGFIQKPFTRKELSRALREVMGKG